MPHFLTLPRPMPTPWAGAEVFSKLLARKVTVRSGKPMDLKTGRGATSNYEDADGRLILLGVCDLPILCHAGAALTQIPRSAAIEAVREGPSSTLVENYTEVMNVLARLFTYADTLHVRMRAVTLYKHGIPSDLRERVGRAKSIMTWHIDISDYGTGTLMIFDLQP